MSYLATGLLSTVNDVGETARSIAMRRFRFVRFRNENDANATVSEMTVLQLLKFCFASASGTL